MGITVTSSATAAASTNALAGLTAGATGQPGEGLSADFAMLLSQFGAGGLTTDQLAASASADKAANEAKNSDDPNTVDLNALIQNTLPFLPPGGTNLSPDSNDTSLADITAKLSPDGKKGTRALLSTTDDTTEKAALTGLIPGQNGTAATGINPSAPPSTALDKSGLPTTGMDFRSGQLETANIAAETPGATPFNNALTTANRTQQAATSHPASSADIPTALHDRQWSNDFSEKIVWLAKNDQQVAQININPPQLGPLQININLNGDQASAIFTSPHAEVRQAIEDALPRLREMLSSSGISLGQANVGAQLPQQNRENPSQFANGTRSNNENAILPGDGHSGASAGAQVIQRGRGLVDLFA